MARLPARLAQGSGRLASVTRDRPDRREKAGNQAIRLGSLLSFEASRANGKPMAYCLPANGKHAEPCTRYAVPVQTTTIRQQAK